MSATEQKHDVLRRLAKNATPGPWFDVGRGSQTLQISNKQRRAGNNDVIIHWLGFDGGNRQPSEKMANAAYIAAANPSMTLTLLDIIDQLEVQVEKYKYDSEMLDWLEASPSAHGFCHEGYGDYKYNAWQIEGRKTVRQVIEAAMKGQQ